MSPCRIPTATYRLQFTARIVLPAGPQLHENITAFVIARALS